jgi:hypothetical protein
MEIGFDLISDLYLSPDESFNWENKSTSLYCIIAGNISHDLRTIYQTLAHLSRFYQGIFYVPGLLEYKDEPDSAARTAELIKIVKKTPKVALLYHNVVIVDGLAILGANAWNADDPNEIDTQLVKNRLDDIAYLNQSVAKLQTHLDVKKIIVVTSCIPKRELYFGKIPDHVGDHIYPDYCLKSDTEFKITDWAFGSLETEMDTVFNSIHYVNNPYFKKRPYYPKRITITL